jgi:hypothetical protein
VKDPIYISFFGKEQEACDCASEFKVEIDGHYIQVRKY